MCNDVNISIIIVHRNTPVKQFTDARFNVKKYSLQTQKIN